MRTYRPSWKELLKNSSVFPLMISILGLGSSVANKHVPTLQEAELFSLILIGSELFGIIVIGLFTFGEQITISATEIIFSRSWLSLIIPSMQERISITEIKEVYLGAPKITRMRSFGAINIETGNKEISFNPDPFEKITIHNFFRELKEKNPTIAFDEYAQKMLLMEDANAVLRNKVLSTIVLYVPFIVFSALLWHIILLQYTPLSSIKQLPSDLQLILSLTFIGGSYVPFHIFLSYFRRSKTTIQ